MRSSSQMDRDELKTSFLTWELTILLLMLPTNGFFHLKRTQMPYDLVSRLTMIVINMSEVLSYFSKFFYTSCNFIWTLFKRNEENSAVTKVNYDPIWFNVLDGIIKRNICYFDKIISDQSMQRFLLNNIICASSRWKSGSNQRLYQTYQIELISCLSMSEPQFMPLSKLII